MSQTIEMTPPRACDGSMYFPCKVEGPGNARPCHEGNYGVSHPDFVSGRVWCQCPCHRRASA